MPPITVDGQSVSIDGRRIWVVAAGLDYARLPKAMWASRLRAIREAGFNSVVLPIVWSVHEPRAGAISFKDDLDVASLVREIGALGMHCIVRTGPFTGTGWDLGGLPAWLLKDASQSLRSGHPIFLASVSRFISALCDEIAGLQVTGTSKKRSGPILMVQSEHRWFCRDEAQGDAYLGELLRFLREGGINVPIINTNNLYQSPEGTIDAWNADDQLFAHMRQIGVLRPKKPRIAVGLHTTDASDSGDSLLRLIAECIAAGSQWVVEPFADGPAPGFLGDGMPAILASLGPGGERGTKFDLVKRAATFATSFERVMTALDPAFEPAVVAPSPIPAGGWSVIHRRGTQGSLAVIFGAAGKGGVARILLPDGTALSINVDTSGVAWTLFDAHLVDRAMLDWSSLSPLGVVGQCVALFGVAGSVGQLSINGSPIEVDVPAESSREPNIIEHEGVTLVVLNEEMVDATYLNETGMWIGIAGLTADAKPLQRASWSTAIRIGPDATIQTQAMSAPKGSRGGRIAITDWTTARTDDLVDGVSDRYAVMAGPASLESIGVPYGYAWMRLKMKVSGPKKVRAGFLETGDRLNLFVGGVPSGVIGHGPGADGWATDLALKAGEQFITALVDNTGRPSNTPVLDGTRGIYGHPWELKAFKAGASKVENAAPLSLLAWRTPIMGVEADDRTDAKRLTWRFAHRKSSPLALIIDPDPKAEAPPWPVVLIVNEKPVRMLNIGPAGDRALISEESLSRGNNVVQIATLRQPDEVFGEIKSRVSIHECAAKLAEKSEWALAKWEPPARGAWEPWNKTSKTKRGRPAWFKAAFTAPATDRPIYFDAAGLSKGQLFINGHNVGRYWVATTSGKSVDIATRLFIPDAWLKPGAPNEISLFDEGGFAPEKVTLTY